MGLIAVFCLAKVFFSQTIRHIFWKIWALVYDDSVPLGAWHTNCAGVGDSVLTLKRVSELEVFGLEILNFSCTMGLRYLGVGDEK